MVIHPIAEESGPPRWINELESSVAAESFYHTYKKDKQKQQKYL